MDTHQVNKEVRLVLCPKCRQLLPEWPDVPLYECGGCGLILQAKNRKMETNQSEQSPQTSGDVAKTQQDNGSVEKKDRSSNHDSSSPFSGESTHHNDIGEDRIVISTSPEVNCSESDQGSAMKAIIHLRHEENNCSSDQNTAETQKMETSQTEVSSQTADDVAKTRQDDGSGEKKDISLNYDSSTAPNGESTLHEDLGEDRSVISASPEVNCGESEDSVSGDNIPTGLEEINCPSDQNSGRNSTDELPSSTEAEESTSEPSGEIIPDDEKCTRKDQNECEESQGAFEESNNFLHEVRNLSKFKDQETDLPSSAEIVSHGIDSSAHSAQPNVEVDGNVEPLCTPSPPRADTEFNTNVSDSTLAPQNAPKSIKSVDLMSPNNVEVLCTLSPSRAETEFNTSVGDASLAPQSSPKSIISVDLTSPNNAHHGSSSSVDTTDSSSLIDPDVKIVNWTNSPTTKSYYAYDGSESSYEATDDHIPNNISHPSHRKSKNFNPVSTTDVLNSEPEMNYWRPSSLSILHENQHHAINTTHWNRNKFTETKNHSLVTTGHGIKTGICSGSYQNLLPPHPGFHRPDKHSYSVPDKMDLLKTVCEFKEQLDRLQFSEVTQNPRIVPEMEMYSDFNHPGYNLRHNQAKSWVGGQNVPRSEFSGNVSHYRHQNWPYSAQFPSHGTHTVHNRHNTYSSSSQHYHSSELSVWGRESESENRHRENEIKRTHLKEKYHKSKKHLVPVAGGAPILACYHCSEILQLPADFLIFKKKYHQLRCIFCKKVLKFSLINRTSIVPYVSDASAPQPESVLFSDEYIRTFNRETSSGSSYKQEEDRKMKSVLKGFRDKKKGFVERFESSGVSSKGLGSKQYSEIEEEKPSNSFPLHWLMGYSTPSQVFKK